MQTTTTNAARLTAIHPGTPDSYKCYINGLKIVRQTPKAVLFEGPQGRTAWMPKAVISHTVQNQPWSTVDVILPAWLYRKVQASL